MTNNMMKLIIIIIIMDIVVFLFGFCVGYYVTEKVVYNLVGTGGNGTGEGGEIINITPIPTLSIVGSTGGYSEGIGGELVIFDTPTPTEHDYSRVETPTPMIDLSLPAYNGSAVKIPEQKVFFVSNQTINNTKATIIGNDNIINGDYNIVFGNHNTVKGNHVIVIGGENDVDSINYKYCTVMGTKWDK
jgi:hypothetical protein